MVNKNKIITDALKSCGMVAPGFYSDIALFIKSNILENQVKIDMSKPYLGISLLMKLVGIDTENKNEKYYRPILGESEISKLKESIPDLKDINLSDDERENEKILQKA